jgi:hypothetical protein
MLFVSGRVTQHELFLAWGYVGLRAAHSLVHLTFNIVLIRLIVFAGSNIVLVIMWTMFFFGQPAS